MAVWLVFLSSAAVVAIAGARLARSGDVIAEGTGLGGLWVGAIVMAIATSLPEVATGISAVREGHPNLAIGDLLGASMANMLTLAVADLLTRRTRVLARVAVNQALVGTLAVGLTATVALGVLAPDGAIAGVGWPLLVVGLGYVGGMRLLHVNRPEPPFRAVEAVDAARPARAALRRAALELAAAATVIVVASPVVVRAAAALATRLGISDGFAGMVLLAACTSLPEASVTVASVRAGSYDLAVGNLLGSNSFNMAALAVLDLVHGPGSMLAGAGRDLVVGALVAILLMTLALLDVLNRSDRRLWMVEPGPALMVAVYVAGLILAHGTRP